MDRFLNNGIDVFHHTHDVYVVGYSRIVIRGRKIIDAFVGDEWKIVSGSLIYLIKQLEDLKLLESQVDLDWWKTLHLLFVCSIEVLVIMLSLAACMSIPLGWGLFQKVKPSHP